jgi:hypothetical protein
MNLEKLLKNSFDVKTIFQNAEFRLYQLPDSASNEKQRFDVYVQVNPEQSISEGWETAKKKIVLRGL